MRPCREQIACGIISPKTTIPAVAPTIATVPDVKSSKKIVKVLFTSTFPNNNVHKRKLPCWRHGKTFFAYFFSSGSPTQKTNYGGVNLVVVLIHFVEVIKSDSLSNRSKNHFDPLVTFSKWIKMFFSINLKVEQKFKIAYANNVPASIKIFSCCGSSAINPKFKPENVPERHKRITRTITLIFFIQSWWFFYILPDSGLEELYHEWLLQIVLIVMTSFQHVSSCLQCHWRQVIWYRKNMYPVVH